MKRRITTTLISLVVLASTPVLAETAAPTEGAPDVGTNIIGTQEAPTVLNVVPWKDKEVKLEKKDPTSSLLDRVLEPLDQEVLLRDVEYYNILNKDDGADTQFLE